MIIKINNFRGDLTDMSAKKEALIVWWLLAAGNECEGACLRTGQSQERCRWELEKQEEGT